jgi:sugar phosphate isomerase/epimerase
MIWQQMDYLQPAREFASRLFHVHAKDATLDRQQLDDVGILAEPLQYHTPKIPGLGDVDWEAFISVLNEVGYQGHVCVEVEDRDYEQTLERRQQALIESVAHLRPLINC